MPLSARREQALGEVTRLAMEAVSLDDLDGEVVPQLKQAFDANLLAIVRFGDENEPHGIAGDLAECAPREYFSYYAPEDPVQVVLRRLHPDVLLADRHLERRAFEESEAYRDYYIPLDVAHVMSTRFSTPRYYLPGSSLMVLFRPRSRGPFTPDDERALRRIRPAFESLARRGRRLEILHRARSFVEALLENDDALPRLVLDDSGRRVLFASKNAERLLGPLPTLPDGLVEAARKLLALGRSRRAGGDAGFTVTLTGARGAPLECELHLERSPTGEPFVVVEVDDAEQQRARAAAHLAARHGLTRAEAVVLEAIGSGLSNLEIARRLCVSVPTVKTHVHRVLAKLGATSRLQAALRVAPRRRS